MLNLKHSTNNFSKKQQKNNICTYEKIVDQNIFVERHILTKISRPKIFDQKVFHKKYLTKIINPKKIFDGKCLTKNIRQKILVRKIIYEKMINKPLLLPETIPKKNCQENIRL